MQTDGYQDFLRQVGRRVRAARKMRGLTQEQLGERIGTDRVYIGYIEQARRNASLPTLHALSKALDVDVSYFFLTDDSI